MSVRLRNYFPPSSPLFLNIIVCKSNYSCCDLLWFMRKAFISFKIMFSIDSSVVSKTEELQIIVAYLFVRFTIVFLKFSAFSFHILKFGKI